MQIDTGSVVNSMGYVEDFLNLENEFEIASLFVREKRKNYGHVRKDVLNIDFTKLINAVKMEEMGILTKQQ